MSEPPIYMDHHATTPVDERVLAAMLPYFVDRFGNAASRTHAHGKAARDAVERGRALVAGLVGAKPDEVIFTSGATESDNLAIRGAAQARLGDGKHIVTRANRAQGRARYLRSPRTRRLAASPGST